MIKNVYTCSSVRIKVNSNKISERKNFDNTRGLRWLFSVASKSLQFEQCNQNMEDGADYGFKLSDFELSTLLYGDDQILLFGLENDVQKTFYAYGKIMNDHNLSIPTETTKLIAYCGK